MRNSRNLHTTPNTIPGTNGGPSINLRVPGAGDHDALEQLSQRVGQSRPSGSLMIAERGGDVIAAVPLDGGPALAEDTVEAASAVAVLRFRIEQLHHGHLWTGRLSSHRGVLAA
ncbi:MAG TPA: hypothetical protein VGY97_04935 [Solirubrobacteraceae bacterium]|jgi:hypothetical protein|nr:hypothetical protein [Solirubrobacteraceae bacterium]